MNEVTDMLRQSEELSFYLAILFLVIVCVYLCVYLFLSVHVNGT